MTIEGLQGQAGVRPCNKQLRNHYKLEMEHKIRFAEAPSPKDGQILEA